MKKGSFSKRHFNRLVKNQLNDINISNESIFDSTIEPKESRIVSHNVSLSSTSDFTSTNLFPVLECNVDDNSHNVDSKYVENMYCDLDSSKSFSQPSSSSDESIINYELDNNSKNNYNTNEMRNETIFEKLQNWSIEFKINHKALQGLLSILRETPTFQNLPKDPRTFLMTPKTTIMRVVKPGLYYHFGILKSLNNIFNKQLSVPLTIKLAINIDGLPLSKSSGSQLYPILGIVKDYKPLNNIVFPIGIYHGQEKPCCFNNFLEEFVSEAVSLCDKEITVAGKLTRIEICMLLFDTVAKASVLQIKGHAGYYSCSKCTAEGEYINGRMCFPETNFTKRTNEDFRNQTDEHHHIGETILTRISDMDLISIVPLDYMHLVLLGVVKKLLVGTWINGKPPNKLPSVSINQISEQLLSFRQYIPREFSRKPRSLKEAKRFKATEYRLFLLYLGPLVLKGVLDTEKYDHFITLHLAISILISNKTFEGQYVDYAEKLLDHFVKSCGLIYSKEFMVHNIHNLLHLCNDVRKFGPLDNFSNFPFENYLGELKKLLRKPSDVLAQIVRRLSESQNFSYSTLNFNSQQSEQQRLNTLEYKLTKIKQDEIMTQYCVGPQYEELTFPLYKLTLSENNRCCKLKCDTIIEIFSFSYESQSNKPIAIGKKYLNITNFYDKPDRSSLIGIHFVSNLCAEYELWNIENISIKLVRLPFDHGFVVFPLLHTS